MLGELTSVFVTFKKEENTWKNRKKISALVKIFAQCHFSYKRNARENSRIKLQDYYTWQREEEWQNSLN